MGFSNNPTSLDTWAFKYFKNISSYLSTRNYLMRFIAGRGGQLGRHSRACTISAIKENERELKGKAKGKWWDCIIISKVNYYNYMIIIPLQIQQIFEIR